MSLSPFPGMDPYLEPHWLDIHTKLVAYAADMLNSRLPEDLAASTEERVAVESDEEVEKRFHPDVRIFEPNTGATSVVESPASEIAIVAPVRLLLQVESATERFIRIVETATKRLITVIEFVSPSNKRNPGLVDFRSKRIELLNAGVNFVEVDLVRGGDWQALLRPHRCPSKWVTPYRVTVRTPSEPGVVGLYPIPLRQPLPSVVIPLRPKDPVVQVDLQTLIQQAYVNGRYARRLTYNQPLDPPLDSEDQEWAGGLIR